MIFFSISSNGISFVSTSFDTGISSSSGASLTFFPHFGQNTVPSLSSAPQNGHVSIELTFSPHFGQNVSVSRSSAPQFLHFMIVISVISALSYFTPSFNQQLN